MIIRIGYLWARVCLEQNLLPINPFTSNRTIHPVQSGVRLDTANCHLQSKHTVNNFEENKTNSFYYSI